MLFSLDSIFSRGGLQDEVGNFAYLSCRMEISTGNIYIALGVISRGNETTLVITAPVSGSTSPLVTILAAGV